MRKNIAVSLGWKLLISLGNIFLAPLAVGLVNVLFGFVGKKCD